MIVNYFNIGKIDILKLNSYLLKMKMYHSFLNWLKGKMSHIDRWSDE